MCKTIQSNALWPKDTILSIYGDITISSHCTEQEAEIVLDDFNRNGVYSDRLLARFYPLKTWISDIQIPPQIPK